MVKQYLKEALEQYPEAETNYEALDNLASCVQKEAMFAEIGTPEFDVLRKKYLAVIDERDLQAVMYIKKGATMAFKVNTEKVKRIVEQGVTADCPLFRGMNAKNLPSWVWHANEIKAETFNLLGHFFGFQSLSYIKTVVQFGGAATDNEVAIKLGWPSSTVSARRNSLKRLGIIKSYPGKEKVKRKGIFYVKNTVWELDFGKLKDFFIDNGGEIHGENYG